MQILCHDNAISTENTRCKMSAILLMVQLVNTIPKWANKPDCLLLTWIKFLSNIHNAASVQIMFTGSINWCSYKHLDE